MSDDNFYTSRSSIEYYGNCKRYRFLHDLYDGKGLVPIYKSIPLVTGSVVHEGIRHILARAKLTSQLVGKDLGDAIFLAKKLYYDILVDKKFGGPGTELDAQQKWTRDEQEALAEALIRAWSIAELPHLIKRFYVVQVEKERLVELAPGIILQTRTDAELIDKVSGEYFNYSLKTWKKFDERGEKSYKKDLQGITEIYGVEQETGKRVGWVRFCFLIKGIRKKQYENQENSKYITYSPLIRGYRNIGPTGIGYAHSWYFPNPNNQSGKGALGRGWEGFNAWETEGGIRNWIKLLATNTIQPECGNVLNTNVYTPIEYSRNQNDLRETIIEITAQEKEVKLRRDRVLEKPELLPILFPRNRSHCHYPQDCEFLDICWKPEVREDPIGSGGFEYRVPHHEAEREQREAEEEIEF